MSIKSIAQKITVAIGMQSLRYVHCSTPLPTPEKHILNDKDLLSDEEQNTHAVYPSLGH